MKKYRIAPIIIIQTKKTKMAKKIFQQKKKNI